MVVVLSHAKWANLILLSIPDALTVLLPFISWPVWIGFRAKEGQSPPEEMDFHWVNETGENATLTFTNWAGRAFRENAVSRCTGKKSPPPPTRDSPL